MKLELDVLHHLLHVYTTFQIDISKHVEKKPGQTLQNSRQNSENNIFTKNGTYVEKYTASHLCTKFEEFILIFEAMIAKTEFDLLLVVN